jgi:hypothetical protein
MVEPRIEADFNELLAPLLGMAEEMLEQAGKFSPFGARIAAGGQVAVVDVAPTMQNPSNPLIVDALYAAFRVEARAGTIRACAVVWDALVSPEEGGGLVDAIAVGLEHRDGEPAMVLQPYQRDATGEIRFAERMMAAGRRHVFGSVLLA